MPPAVSHGRFRDWDLVTRLAVTAWAILLGFVCVRIALWPKVHSVYPGYAEAGEHWVRGESLYLNTVFPYRYSPFTALLLVPLQFVPAAVGGIFGRMLSAAVFLLAFRWWLRRAVPQPLSERQRSLILFLSAPLIVGSLNNGQLNLLAIGLLLAAVAATAESRWWLAAACLALATGMKLYPLALGLLLWVLYPRKLTLPLIVNFAVAALAPFLFQHVAYVLGQYGDWYRVLAHDDRRFLLPEVMYRDLWLLFRDAGVPMTPGLYLSIQLGSAAGCALLCLRAKALGWPAPALVTVALALGSCWMMLCGPATENCTYTILAPTLAYLTVTAIAPDAWPRWLRYLPAAAFAMFFLWSFTGVLPSAARGAARDAQPLATLVLSVAYGLVTVGRLRLLPVLTMQKYAGVTR